MIRFAEFLPDQPALENPGTTVAKNVIPAARGYRSIKALSDYSDTADDRIRGFIAVKDANEVTSVYVGDEAKLYRLSGSSSTALTNASKAGGYATATRNRWRFVEWGGQVIATNYDDPMQVETIGAGAFADLTGSPPQARYIAVVRDQIFTGYTKESGTTYPYRVRWSGIGSETVWGSSATSGSDFQDINDLGAVTGVVGGEYGVILLERGIMRAQFVGPPLFYQFDLVEAVRGCKYPGSVAAIGRNVFYCSDDGFYMFDGAGSKPVGAERVNKFFLNDLNADFGYRITASVDPLNQIIVVSYPTAASTSGRPDRLLIYNYSLDRWSYADVDNDGVGSLMTAGYTLEELDNVSSSLDSLPASLDSIAWKGGQFLFAGINDTRLALFSGSALAATIETAEFQAYPGRRAVLRKVIPYSEGSTSVTAQVGTRARQQDTATFGSAASLNSEGYIPVRSEGRYHTVRVNLSGDWTQAQGIDVEATQLGVR